MICHENHTNTVLFESLKLVRKPSVFSVLSFFLPVDSYIKCENFSPCTKSVKMDNLADVLRIIQAAASYGLELITNADMDLPITAHDLDDHNLLMLQSALSVLDHQQKAAIIAVMSSRTRYRLTIPRTIRKSSVVELLNTPSEIHFKDQFRLNRELFAKVVMDLKPALDPEGTSGLIGPESALTSNRVTLIVSTSLHILGSGGTLAVAGEFMGLGTSTAMKYFTEFLNAATRTYERSIGLPTIAIMNEEAKQFEAILKNKGAVWTPKVIGAVDGTHIFIDKPVVSALSFWSHKTHHSVQVQALCKHTTEIVHLAIGAPGRCHDARVFAGSQLLSLIPPQFSILGDGAYPFSEGRVINPFPDDGTLDRAKVNFNFMQSSARMCIERCFGILKLRFRILQGLHYRDIDTIKHIIFVACALHNICTRARLELEPEEKATLEELLEASKKNPLDEEADAEPRRKSSVEKQRMQLCNRMFGLD